MVVDDGLELRVVQPLPALGVHAVVGLVQSLVQRGAHGHDLEGGARLVEIRHRAVARFLRGVLGQLVGIDAGHVRHGQHFPRLRLQDDAASGLGLVQLHAAGEFLGGDGQIHLADGQHHAAAVDRLDLGVVHFGAPASAGVAQVDDETLFARKLVVHLQLDAALSAIVDVGVADDGARQRVEVVAAAGIGPQAHAIAGPVVEAARHHLGDAFFDDAVLYCRVAQHAGNGTLGPAERAGDEARHGIRTLDHRGIHRQRVFGDVGSEDGEVAVENEPAHRGNDLTALVLDAGELLQFLRVAHLHDEQLDEHREEAGGEQRDEQVHANGALLSLQNPQVLILARSVIEGFQRHLSAVYFAWSGSQSYTVSEYGC